MHLALWHFAETLIGKSVSDRASRATKFPFWCGPDCHFTIIISSEHIKIFHGDLCVSLLKTKNVVVELYN